MVILCGGYGIESREPVREWIPSRSRNSRAVSMILIHTRCWYSIQCFRIRRVANRRRRCSKRFDCAINFSERSSTACVLDFYSAGLVLLSLWECVEDVRILGREPRNALCFRYKRRTPIPNPPRRRALASQRTPASRCAQQTARAATPRAVQRSRRGLPTGPQHTRRCPGAADASRASLHLEIIAPD